MIVKRIIFYSDGEKKEKRIKLSDIKSHRGLGRSFLLGGFQGALGGHLGAKKNARTRIEKRRLMESSKR